MTKLKSYEGQEKNRHVRRMSCVMGQYSSGVFVICKPFPIGDAVLYHAYRVAGVVLAWILLSRGNGSAVPAKVP